MAELVDALVSNTSRFTPVPVRSRLRALIKKPAIKIPYDWLLNFSWSVHFCPITIRAVVMAAYFPLTVTRIQIIFRNTN